MIIASFTPKQKKNENAMSTAEKPPSGPVGWMYVGSHNFTQAAWGNLSGSADAPVLNVCSVRALLPLETDSLAELLIH